MSLKFHRNLIVSAMSVSVVHLLLLAGAGYLLLRLQVLPDSLGRLAAPAPGWLLLFGSLEPRVLLLNTVLGIAALALYSTLVNLGVRAVYRKTDSAEILFIMLFSLSMSLEVWRLGSLLLQALGWPQYLNVLITRVVLFSRFFGLLCLLTSSLYAAGLRYTQYPILIGGTAVLAFSLVGILPLDTSLYAPTFIFELGDRQGFLFIRIILGLLMLINFLIAARLRRSRRFLLVAGAGLALFIGRELLQNGIAPLPLAAGTLLLVLGIVVYVRQVVVFYLGL